MRSQSSHTCYVTALYLCIWLSCLVSLVQCYSGVPAELRKLLACAVPKLGVNIGGDAAKLMRDYQASTCELD